MQSRVNNFKKAALFCPAPEFDISMQMEAPMTYFITTFGIIYTIMGVIFFMKPEYVRAIMDFFKVGRRVYIAGILRIVIGAFLIYAGEKAVIPWIPRIIGIIAVIGGIIIYSLGIQRTHAMMDWWKGSSDKKIRLIAVIAEIVGILLVYSA
jgi:uncharacterized membrane protein